ncbi:MAG: AAA family ATPase [bacterium]
MQSPTDDLDLNSEFKQGLKLLEDPETHVFITGPAGTGKSTLLHEFRRRTERDAAFLAPTGTAAINIDGETIHSFFGFGTDVTVSKVRSEYDDRGEEKYRTLDALVIDEVSMVRADLMDCVDQFLRLNGPRENVPFGGVDVNVIGDLHQLPPVVTSSEKDIFQEYYRSPYFFDSRAFENLEYELHELETIYRQDDREFLSILQSIRDQQLSDDELERLNDQVDPDFEPENDEVYVRLTPRNKTADRINENQLEELPGESMIFTGELEGDFAENALPTKQQLRLKENAQVMMVTNDPMRRWVNGSIGTIDTIETLEDEDQLTVDLRDGGRVEVEPYTWTMYEYAYDDENDSLQAESVGSFTQFPVMLSWAITIHKSQGKTFDNVILDVGKGMFAHGQGYVALSRCVSLEGLVLRKPLKKKHFFSDRRIVDYLAAKNVSQGSDSLSLDETIDLLRRAVQDQTPVRVTHLTSDNSRRSRVIHPRTVDQRKQDGQISKVLVGFCEQARAKRVVPVDRILAVEPIK